MGLAKIFSKRVLFSALPWIMLSVGLLSFFFGIFTDFQNKHWKEIWTGLGKTILASGIFALVLKSIQFMGVFKEELEKIIFEPKFIQNRNDLPDYWEKITKELFKNNFPKINTIITKDVKETYLPTTSVQYYDNVRQAVTITIKDPINEYVEVVQSTYFTIFPTEPNIKFSHKFKNTIRCTDEKDPLDFQIMRFKVNDKDQLYDLKKERQKTCLITTYDITLEGKKGYDIEMTIKKIYSLKHDNVISYATDFVKNNFRVQFFLKGVSLDFFSAGTLKRFKSVKEDDDYLEMEYQGIIYPKQGYIAIIKKL